MCTMCCLQQQLLYVDLEGGDLKALTWFAAFNICIHLGNLLLVDLQLIKEEC